MDLDRVAYSLARGPIGWLNLFAFAGSLVALILDRGPAWLFGPLLVFAFCLSQWAERRAKFAKEKQGC